MDQKVVFKPIRNTAPKAGQAPQSLAMSRGQARQRSCNLDNRLPDRRNQVWGTKSERVRVFIERVGNTLTVWFGDSQNEYVAEETDTAVVLT